MSTQEEREAEGITTRKEVHGDNLYAIVKSLSSGVIFQVEGGAPWLRTAEGVVDWIPIVLPISLRQNTIPEVWHEYTYRVFVIYEEES
jgi:hypothetical protein